MKQKTDVATRRSKRQKGEDASVESLKTQRRRKKLVMDPNVETEDTEVREPEVQEENDDDVREPEVQEPSVETTPNVETEDTQHSTEAGETEQPPTKTKRRRGLTRMSKVAKNHDDKIEVEFISVGEHVGVGSVTLSSFLGVLVREHVPVLLGDWRHLDEQTRDRMWEQIQARFNLTETWQKESVFKQMGCIWRSSKSRLVSLVRAIGCKEQLINLKPSNVHSVSAWMNWVKTKKGKDFKVQSDKFRELRRSQIPHTTSRKGMVRLAHEMKKKSSDPTKVTRSKVWVAGHTHSDGRPVRPEFEETIKQRDDVSNSEVSDLCKGGPRCQILDWCSSDDVVIGEGEFCSAEPTYKIGRIPLGPNAAAIFVKSVIDEEASVWRPTSTVTTIGQAVGLKIAWQFDKIILDEMDSSAINKTFDSSATDAKEDKILIYDWLKDDEVIAEGRLGSTDPKTLVNNIPLGPNASIVKIDRVLNKDGSLWRPNEEMLVIGDALGENIAWPIHKISMANIQASPGISKSRSPGSFSHSSNTSKNEKRKCILVDCKGSGKMVAEGRVFSTNPEDVTTRKLTICDGNLRWL